MIITYLIVTFSIFIANVIPVFAPPTWILLSLFKVSYPELNIVVLAALGVFGSVAGRLAMYLYSKILGKYVPQRYMGNISYFRKTTDGRKRGLFFGSFAYSLSPLPSNFLFIGSGITGMKIVHMLTGFAVGRTISYIFLIQGFYKTYAFLGILSTEKAFLLGNLLGIIIAISMIFIDIQKIIKKVADIASFIRNMWQFDISTRALLSVPVSSLKRISTKV